MTGTDVRLLVAAVVLIGLAAFLVAAQTALSRFTLNRAEKLAEERRAGAGSLEVLLADPPRALNLLALGVVAAQVTSAAFVAVVAVRLWPGGPGLALGIVASTVALFAGSEVAPKTLALQRTEGVALRTAPLVRMLVAVLGPLASLLIWLGNVIAPGRGLEGGPFVTSDDLRDMIEVAESDDVIESSERDMLSAIFELGDTVVREIMVPRPDMVVVPAEADLRAVLEVILEAGHSRVPVYQDDKDTIVGLIYAKDVLRRLHTGEGSADDWTDLLRPATFVPELQRIDSLLRELQAAKVHLAIVVDEYGATAGLVTIEDIVEEIVGEIVDEYDTEQVLIEQLENGALRVDARLPVDDLAALFQVDLPDEEWDTVGGLLFGTLGHVPEAGEEVVVDGLRLIAERVQGRRVSKVLARRTETEPADDDEAEAHR